MTGGGGIQWRGRVDGVAQSIRGKGEEIEIRQPSYKCPTVHTHKSPNMHLVRPVEGKFVFKKSFAKNRTRLKPSAKEM